MRSIKLIIQKLVFTVISPLYPLARKAFRSRHPAWKARQWSNAELRRWAGECKGRVINVSAWLDDDKEGGKYRSYFTSCESYVISNLQQGEKGSSSDQEEIPLDLTKTLPPELRNRFDVVFNHTTLEHIYDVNTASRVLCDLSRDLVIVVVPFVQEVHWIDNSFLDYWRFTPFAIDRLFSDNGVKLIYWATNENPVWSQYLFAVGSKNPEKWKNVFPSGDSVVDKKRIPAYSWCRDINPEKWGTMQGERG